MKPAQSTYSHDEIEGRMQNRSFIRACCHRLLKMEPHVQTAKQDLKELIKLFRFLLVSSWNCELDRVAVCNTFKQTATYLDAHCDLLLGGSHDDIISPCNDILRAFSADIVANVYALWIQRLCDNVRPQCAALALAKPRVVLIPQTAWVAAYAADTLVESLETLYARHYPQDGQEPLLLVRLNGERVPCGTV